MEMKSEVKNIERWISELDQFNSTPGQGTTRTVYSQEDLNARKYIKSEMKSIGLTVTEDCVGNIFGTLQGKRPELAPVWTGSHIDTVPNGGKFDGVAGVFAGMEALRLISESGQPFNRNLSVNVYSGEEMSRFGVCCIGSRSIAGRLRLDDFRQHVSPEGVSLYDTLAGAGYPIDDFNNVFPEKSPVYASLELHIEQNGKLEEAKVPVGIVKGICAPTNMTMEVTGVQSHAGGTSMTDRRDAYMASAEIALLLEKLARESDSLYITGTIGEMRLEPNAANVIPGRATFSVDIRSISLEDKDMLLEKFRSGVAEIASRRGVTVKTALMNHDKPVLCDAHLRDVLDHTASELDIPHIDIVSGPYHDSLMLGDITNVGMIFIPSKDGISHNRAEWSDCKDISKGTDILAAAMLKLANE